MKSGERSIHRHAIRAVLLTPQDQVLLMRVQEPASGRELWLTPGGGLRAGERPAECLMRELCEETGLEGFRLGPELWTRRHTFCWAGRTIAQHEVYYLVETERFEPTMKANPAEVETEAFRGFHWWSTCDILESGDLFVPRRLGVHLQELIWHGPPSQPFDVGI